MIMMKQSLQYTRLDTFNTLLRFNKNICFGGANKSIAGAVLQKICMRIIQLIHLCNTNMVRRHNMPLTRCVILKNAV